MIRHGDAVTGRGALVISLDFELHWGVRDHSPIDGPYGRNLRGVRDAVGAMLDTFGDYGVGATWATVGFLFATGSDEVQQVAPRIRPRYARRELDPYDEPIGADESDDPMHLAPSLIERIRAAPQQEIASHTFSHFYCCEAGQDRDAFRADLESAQAVAARRGITLRSLVFPRNQVNDGYLDILRELGFTTYRGRQRGVMYAADLSTPRPAMRALRLVDTYAPLAGHGLTAWSEVQDGSGLCNIPASRFLRPCSDRLAAVEPLRLSRITRAIDAAAASGRIFHLWWHPHNFGADLTRNIAFLRRVLDHFALRREADGMQSLTMAGVADALGVAPRMAS